MIGKFEENARGAAVTLACSVSLAECEGGARRRILGVRCPARDRYWDGEGTGLDAAELYRLTSGNPFYVTEVVQAGLGVVPPSARDAVLAQAARLGSGSREVLDVAALTGARVELDLLTSVTASPLLVLDELLASGLLAADGQWLRFRHEIARLAVEQAVAPHRRAGMHARILNALGLLG